MRAVLKRGLSGIIVGVMLFQSAAFTFAEETTEAAADNKTADGYTIVVIPKMSGITYFNKVQEGAEKAGEELGVNVIYDGPETASAESQVSLIASYAAQGVDAICVAANDMAAVGASLMTAQETTGVTVMDWDSQCAESITSASVYNVNDKDFGEHMIDKLVELMGPSGDYAIITGGEDAPNLNAWIDAGQKYAQLEYPDLNLVTIPVPTDENEDKAYEVTLEIIDSFPDLKGILGYSTPTAPGCARAIQERGLQDEIVLVANGVESDCAQYREDGSLDCGCLWDCENLGYLTVAAAKYILDGNTIDENFSVDGIEGITVSENGHNIYYTSIGNDF